MTLSLKIIVAFVLGILFTLRTVDMVSPFPDALHYYSLYAYLGTLFFALAIMLFQGKFVYTIWGKVTYFSAGLGVIGFIFKVMHWPWAIELLMLGFGAAVVAYLISFILKTPKKAMDIYKVIVVILGFAIPILIILRRIPSGYDWIPHLLFFGLFVWHSLTAPEKAAQNPNEPFI